MEDWDDVETPAGEDRTMMKRAALLLGFVGLFGLTARADIVLNGGFETGDFTDWTVTGADLGYTGVSSSACPPGGVSDLCTPHTGTYAAFFTEGLESGGATGITQLLTTTIGHSYTLDFWLETDVTDAGIHPSSFSVYWNTWDASGLVLAHSDPDVPPWTKYELSGLSAVSTSTLLHFDIFDNPDWMGLDDIVLTDNTPGPEDTPEPVSITLSALGLLWVGAARARRSAARG